MDPTQGCQIFLCKTYQNGKKYTKCPQNALNGHKLYRLTIKKHKMAIKLPTSSIARPTKTYPKRDFWFENVLSGNTDPTGKKRYEIS
jgi:hypothetical protein